MFGIELMRLLAGRPEMEIETYRMRDGSVLVLVENEKGIRYEVTVYDRSDIEQKTFPYFFLHDAKKQFEEIKKQDQSVIDPKSGAKR